MDPTVTVVTSKTYETNLYQDPKETLVEEVLWSGEHFLTKVNSL